MARAATPSRPPQGLARALLRSEPEPAQLDLPERLWTHKETAAFLRLPEATLHQLNYKGTGPRSFKVGRHRRYDPRDLIAWLEERSSDCFYPT